ncbi:uncharacterized protein LOC119167978 isoform X2 [Rhipicephalus microplus]|uniref:uncharacterized protein LOC119167978 isoform X2 n=1 Tax=Rhipicephalus microplus TaxID=6941 RepID=UPI003F6C83C7
MQVSLFCIQNILITNRTSNKFFSTSKPIWTHTTTGKTNLRCLVDQVNEMKQKFIIYTRSCYNKEYKVSRILYGTFYEHRRKHMDVKPEGCWVVLDGNNWPYRKWSCSIKEFYYTSEPIWTHTTSGYTRIRCLVDRVNAMEKKSVFFTRSCYNRGHKVSRAFEGIFVTGRKKHMDVKNLGKGMGFQEDLLYATDDYRCAVVMVTTTVCGKHRTYDLRIRGAYIILKPPPKCLEHYLKFEKHGTVVYEKNCTDILKRQQKAGLYEPQNDRCGNRVH